MEKYCSIIDKLRLVKLLGHHLPGICLPSISQGLSISPDNAPPLLSRMAPDIQGYLCSFIQRKFIFLNAP